MTGMLAYGAFQTAVGRYVNLIEAG